jgi:D-lactate dehydrogenase
MKNKVVFFSSLPHDVESFNGLKNSFLDESVEFEFISKRLNQETVHLVHDSEIICVFVNDQLNKNILNTLKQKGLRLIVLRCAGYNNVDLDSAKALGISVLRVPAYSPHAVAEHAVAMMMCLNRKLHTAHKRTQDGNFSIDGLMGFDMVNKTAGIIGTGKIGLITAQILKGLGMRLLAYDPYCQEKLDFISYLSLDEVLGQSDILSLHCPLNQSTKHLINSVSLAKMKKGAILINTSRGAVLDTQAVITALKSGQLASFGMDVYEKEDKYFHADHSAHILPDDELNLLKSFPNVLITSHQAFFTQEAVSNIASITLTNIKNFINKQAPELINVLIKIN